MLLSPLFPFITIPHNIISAKLLQERPFVWKAVMLVACCGDGARQVEIGQTLLREVTEAAYMHGHKSLDLLQSVQVLVSW